MSKNLIKVFGENFNQKYFYLSVPKPYKRRCQIKFNINWKQKSLKIGLLKICFRNKDRRARRLIRRLWKLWRKNNRKTVKSSRLCNQVKILRSRSSKNPESTTSSSGKFAKLKFISEKKTKWILANILNFYSFWEFLGILGVRDFQPRNTGFL